MEDGVQNKTFSYDKLGRVKKEIRTILTTSSENPLPSETQGPYITETKYDLLGRVTRIDYPEHPISHGRMRACYNYGTAGYISGISVQVNTNGILPGFCNKNVVENISYNEFGQTAGFTLGNGIETTYGYDVKGRMVRLRSSGAEPTPKVESWLRKSRVLLKKVKRQNDHPFGLGLKRKTHRLFEVSR